MFALGRHSKVKLVVWQCRQLANFISRFYPRGKNEKCHPALLPRPKEARPPGYGSPGDGGQTGSDPAGGAADQAPAGRRAGDSTPSSEVERSMGLLATFEMLLEHCLQSTPSPLCGLAPWTLLGACSTYPG